MRESTKWCIAGLAGLMLAVAPARAQFEFGGKEIQLHGFFSQGFTSSDTNNFLTMKSNSGSFAFTDGGMNISTKLTSRLRVGAQAYSRNIGELSNGRVELDWAYGDYRFTDWLGVRAGKVKTTLGLYNDTQDMEFLHTWAMLPQSFYPLDLRASNISHKGGDLYGEIPVKKLGTLDYTVYGGLRSDDPRGGFRYGLADAGTPISAIDGYLMGADLRWAVPLEGLVIGTTVIKIQGGASAKLEAAGGLPIYADVLGRTFAHYIEYQRNGLKLATEYRRDIASYYFNTPFVPAASNDNRAWYLSGSYRFHPRFEAGAYYSRFIADWDLDHSLPNNKINDTAITARFNLYKTNWNVKAEGHFISGFGNPMSAHSFYTRTNPQGLVPRTNLLILRTGVNF